MQRIACAFLVILTGGVPLAGAANAVHSEPLVTARHSMVVSAQHLATDVGVDILKEGAMR